MSASGTTAGHGGGPSAVFVYGTLLPGHLRWSLVAPFVATSRPARAAGRLYDTGRRYPAALFADHGRGGGPGPPVGEVHGALLVLRPERVTAALEVLDLVEGDEYARIEIGVAEVTSTAITRCWTYEWIAGRERLVPVPGGRWTGE